MNYDDGGFENDQNRCRPPGRIDLLERSPLELCSQSIELGAATTSDLRTLAADTAPSATSSLASLSLPPPAISLNERLPFLQFIPPDQLPS